MQSDLGLNCRVNFERKLYVELSGPPIHVYKLFKYILREKSLSIYFGDSQFRRNRIFNFIISKIYVDKRLGVC